MKQYLDLGHHILANGAPKEDRTGTGTLSIFGYQMRFNLQDGFPLVTTKDMSDFRFDSILEELLWFISGSTHVQPLVDKGVHIWNRDAYKQYTQRTGKEALTYKQFVKELKAGGAFAEQHGSLGPIYGAQWRHWVTAEGKVIDQLADLVHDIKHNPDSRRLILSAWNVGDLPKMALPPCHAFFQCYVVDGVLSGHLYQRSGDYFLGIPYNVASYSALLHALAHCLDLVPGEFVHTLGDAHIYANHITTVQEQLSREPLPLPKLYINPFQKDLFALTRGDFYLSGYQAHGELKGEQSY